MSVSRPTVDPIEPLSSSQGGLEAGSELTSPTNPFAQNSNPPLTSNPNPNPLPLPPLPSSLDSLVVPQPPSNPTSLAPPLASPPPTPPNQVIGLAIPAQPLTPPNSSQSVFSNDIPTRHSKALLLIVVFVLLLILGSGGAAVAVAYEKIKLNNPGLEKPITHLVMSLPFTPKTPRFLLESAGLAHTKVSKHSFNLSLAAKSDDITSNLGFNQIDAEAKGSVDYSDPSNLKTTLNVAVTKDFNADVRKNSSTVYLKINKLPLLLLTAFKLDPDKINPILDNWIAFESKKLDSQADKELDKNNAQKSITAQYLANTIDDLLDENLLPNIGVTNEKQDGHEDYKLHLRADDKAVDQIIYKIEQKAAGDNSSQPRDLSVNRIPPSKFIKDLNIDLWVDQKDYFVRRISTNFTYNPNFSNDATPSRVLGISNMPGANTILAAGPDLFSLGKSKTAIVTVATFDDFGQDFKVETPSTSITPEEFLKKVMDSSSYLSSAQAGARDASRRADIQSIAKALEVGYKVTAGTCDSGQIQNAGTYCPLQAKSFAAGKIPTDPNKDWSYCIISGTNKGIVGNSSVGKCPAGWRVVSAGQPPANTTQWTVCTFLEQAVSSNSYYCLGSQQ